jgi:MFS transporter, FHS family, glucose/mannose:H+ symporter
LQPTSKSKLGWVTAIAFLCLFLLGVIDNLKGATLPAVLMELNFSDAQGGSILLWAYVGFLTAALLVGVLSDIAGYRAVVVVATACLLLGTLGYSLASRLGLLSLSMGVLGIGLGGVDMAGYLIIVGYYAQNKGRYLNLTAFFHGLASTAAPYYAGLLLAIGISWRQIYQFPLVFVLLTLALGLFVRFPKTPVEQKSRIDFRSVGKVIFQPVMGWYFALMILYVSAEIGVASWIVIYLQRVHNLEVTASAGFLSLYFAGLMLGRLIGTVFVDKVGYLRSILIMTLCAAACLAVGIYGPGRSYWLLPLTGLFFSIIFPTLTAAVTDRVTGNVGTVMGLLFAFCGIGGALGPWLIGLISDLAGIQAGFAVNLVSTVGMAAIALVLVRLNRRAVRLDAV